MEKLGVVLDDEKVKQASTSEERCPSCGEKLYPRKVQDMPMCPNCGTKPFEKRPTK